MMLMPSRIGRNGASQSPGRGGALSALLMQPVVVGGQVELADAAGDGGALLDPHQPLVLAQVLAGLARRLEQVGRRRARCRRARC